MYKEVTIMSERQALIKILEKMPEDTSMADIVETLNLIYELGKRIGNKEELTSQEDFKKEIDQWT
jgi:hypothetical protein